MDNNFSSKSSQNYRCYICDYNTPRISQYKRHLLTDKHKKRENTTCTELNTTEKFEYRCECGKIYPYRASLYNHKKKCNYDTKDNDVAIIKKVEDEDYKKLVLKMVKENKELKNQISQLIPYMKNSTTINNKQKLNINIFLNEQCKDALTMNEFIDKIKISLDNLILTKDKGITEGVSNIFIENMNKLSLYERPMHCTDVKREIVYIKSNDDEKPGISLWEKDSENKKLKDAINKISCVQRKKLDLWIENHPKWQDNIEEQEEYMTLIKNCTDNLQENKRENKIIKKVCTTVQL